MGLISAALQAAGGVLSDTWRDYFFSEAIPDQVLLTKGRKRVGGGSENIISNGSILAVADGQCAIIVEQGKIAELCAQPGEYVYDNATEPSLFYGDLSANIKQTFANLGRRFSFGGSAAKDQRVYFVNTRELMGNKYGTPSPVPFRVVDRNIGLDMDVSIRCFGEYSYRITDPILFYTNVAGNVSGDFTRDKIDSQLKTELLTALQPAFGRISALGIRYSALPGHTEEIANALNEELSLAALDFLRGPNPLSGIDKQFIADRFIDKKDYVPRSYFAGATPQNDYTPSRPLTVRVTAGPYAYQNEGYARLSIRSGGADNPREVVLRKAKDGKWYLWEQYLLPDVRPPESANPWA